MIREARERTPSGGALTRSDGIVQPRVVRAVQKLVDDEANAGIRGEVERLRAVESALLGIAAGR